MAFKPKTKTKILLTSIESMFMDLRNRSVQALFAHQADILRKYEAEMMQKSDVAIELPTGSGKTLVGLLIAVALGNAPTTPAVLTALASRRDHPSALVREHVAWALARHEAEK